MTTSVKKRFFVSFFSNGLRSVMSFLAGLVVARGLGPSDYGQLMFLLGSFVSIRSLLDLGTSNAFYTFIAQAKRPLRYYSYYLLWLAFQFLLTAAVVGLLLPGEFLKHVWLGQERTVILLAFMASFFQQQLWQAVNQIGEASRKTVRVQFLNLALALTYLAGVYALTHYGAISVRRVLDLMILQYLAAGLAAFRVLGPAARDIGQEQVTPSEMFRKYRDYCAPLAALSLATFFYDFADKWMLQRFGGAIQQGFYQVSYQFAVISILATTSILNIFWKEIAESTKNEDGERVKRIFRKVSRGLYMFSAVVSGFLIPWSGEIVRVFLGEQYSSAGPVLALMFVYPIHQSLGQVASVMLLAGERTAQYLKISVFFMLLSLPVSYLMQAPSSGVVPGFGLGAMGMSVKMVFLNILSVNALLWLIARNHNWKFEFSYQFVAVGVMFAAGFLVKLAALRVYSGPPPADKVHLASLFLVSGLVYVAAAYGVLRAFPGLAGLDKGELEGYIRKIRLPAPQGPARI